MAALSAGEVVALKDMQAEWGPQMNWTGIPSCSWPGIICDAAGNVIQMYVYVVAIFSALIVFHYHTFTSSFLLQLFTCQATEWNYP